LKLYFEKEGRVTYNHGSDTTVNEEKSCESFPMAANEAKKADPKDRRPFGQMRIAHSVDNRRYYL